MLEISIRKGYSVNETDTIKLRQLEDFQSRHLITLVRDEILRCSKCGNQILVDSGFLKRGSGICLCCGKTIYRGKNQFFQQRIAKIHFDQIIEDINRQFFAIFPADDILFDKICRTWIISLNHKKMNISIYGISNTSSFFSIIGDEGIVLYLDGESIRPKINNFNKSRFVFFDDPILKNTESMNKLLDSLDYSNTLKYLELKDQFNSFISKTSSQYFEKKFVPQFIDAIKSNNEKLKILYSRLQTVKDTIINTKFVNIGGPGQPDFFLIDLFDYLQDGLKPEKIGEAKCYSKSTLTASKFGTALLHATSRDTLSIVSTDDIHPFIWSKIIEFKNSEKYYKHVIIDKDLMLLLIYNLELTGLIK